MKHFIAFGLLLISTILIAQTNSENSALSYEKGKDTSEAKSVEFFDRIKEIFYIGNTYDDFNKSFDAKNPAAVFSNLILTKSDSITNYTQIDATIGVDLYSLLYQIITGDLSHNNIGYGYKLLPFAEYHKSTFDKNKISTFKFGGTLNSYYIFNSFLKPKLTASLSYNDAKNYLEEEYSHQSKVDFSVSFEKNIKHFWTYLLPNSDMIFIKKGTDLKFHWLDFMYLPSIGIEYNDIYRSGKNRNGYSLTNYFKINWIIQFFRKIFQVQGEVEWKNVFKNTVINNKMTTNYGLISFNIDVTRIFDTKIAALLLGIEFYNGENPWIGIDMTKKLQFAIKAKL